MNKSILVMDTPKACIDCPCHFAEDTGKIWCGAEKKELLAEDIESYKPDWCPLKDTTEKEDAWIPCSVCLPMVPEGTDDQEFIVMINGADNPTALYCDSHGTWFDDIGEIYDVIAWQLFPEPYAE